MRLSMHLGGFVLTAGLVTSCADSNEKVVSGDPAPEAFVVAESGIVADKTTQTIGIQFDNLDKEFLLQSSLLNQTPIALTSGLRSRIVQFKDVGDAVVMLESPDGQTLNSTFPTNIILAKFPVLKRTDDVVYFDFEKGMSDIFVSGDWYSYSDDSVSVPDTTRTIEVKASYLESVDFVEDRLVIRQIAQVPNASSGVRSVEVKYYLEPYKKNSNFTPSAPADFDKFGYFTTAGIYDDSGRAQAFATKFDISKTIKFGVSANTPKEYQQAVIDGILYWNRTLPGNPIEAVIAPGGVTAPDYDLNMVQWVEWDDAGFAYADAQSDPRTGEILHAQVIMTSVFAISGKRRAEALLKQLEKAKENKLESASVSLDGFVKAPLCDHRALADKTHQFVSMLAASDLSDEKILAVSQDYVREVIAHEIGHTVGLRHNFAGSLAQNYDPFQRDLIHQNYLLNDETPWGVVPGSSVMEYQAFKDATLSGEIVESGEAALPYDEKVMASLYSGQSFGIEELPVFCSDGGLSTDCKTFDFGRNPIETQHYQLQTAQTRFASDLVENLVAIELAGQDQALNQAVWADNYFRNLTPVFEILGADFSLLQVRRNFERIDTNNIADVKAAEQSLVENVLNSIDPELRVVDLIPKTGVIDLEKVETEVRLAVDSTSFLDDIAKGRAKARLKNLLVNFENTLVEREMSLLTAPAKLGETNWSDDFLTYLEARTLEVVLATTTTQSAEIVVGAETSTVELPVFANSLEARLTALRALALNREYKPYLVQAMKERAKAKLQNLAALTFGPESLPTGFDGLGDKAGKWWNEYRQMLTIIQ